LEREQPRRKGGKGPLHMDRPLRGVGVCSLKGGRPTPRDIRGEDTCEYFISRTRKGIVVQVWKRREGFGGLAELGRRRAWLEISGSLSCIPQRCGQVGRMVRPEKMGEHIAFHGGTVIPVGFEVYEIKSFLLREGREGKGEYAKGG